MARFTAPTATRGKAPSHSPPDNRFVPGIKLAKALGWFSIGLGVAELLKPHTISGVTGVESQTLLQAYGLREIVCGVGILASNQPYGWVWARVAGDALDLATLGSALMNEKSCHPGTVGSIIAVAGVTALDIASAMQLSAAAGIEG
jgi:hypothetical protein